MTSTGAMTFAFIQAIEKGQGATYGSILNAMRSTIRKTDDDLGGGGGVVTTLLTMLLTGGSAGVGTQVCIHIYHIGSDFTYFFWPIVTYLIIYTYRCTQCL